ncbi:MAG: hypothetical protein ACXWDN_09805, partial [Limisphaerales bacterium]
MLHPIKHHGRFYIWTTKAISDSIVRMNHHVRALCRGIYVLALSAFFANAVEPMNSVISSQEGSSSQLRNRQLTFVFDQKQNTWDAV